MSSDYYSRFPLDVWKVRAECFRFDAKYVLKVAYRLDNCRMKAMFGQMVSLSSPIIIDARVRYLDL